MYTLEQAAKKTDKQNAGRGADLLCGTHHANGYEFISNTFYILARPSDKPKSEHAPEVGWIVEGRKSANILMVFDQQDFIQALKNARIFARNGSNIVVIRSMGGVVTMHASSSETGGMSRTLKAMTSQDWDGGQGQPVDFQIGFNIDYLMECLKYTEARTLEVIGPTKQAYLWNGDKFAAIMPMNIGDSFEYPDVYCPELPGQASPVSAPTVAKHDPDDPTINDELWKVHRAVDTKTEPEEGATDYQTVTAYSPEPESAAIRLQMTNPQQIGEEPKPTPEPIKVEYVRRSPPVKKESALKHYAAPVKPVHDGAYPSYIPLMQINKWPGLDLSKYIPVTRGYETIGIRLNA